MVAILAVGLCSPMALADNTNSYSNCNTPAGLRTTTATETLERTVVLEPAGSSSAVIERTISAPVVIERASASPMVLEDRIIKQKHLFALGVWPLFDFEIK
jgi:hypothetical protein